MEKHNFRVYGYGPSTDKRTDVRLGPYGALTIHPNPHPHLSCQLRGSSSSPPRVSLSTSQAVRWEEPGSLPGLPGECHQTALLVTKSHLPCVCDKGSL